MKNNKKTKLSYLLTLICTSAGAYASAGSDIQISHDLSFDKSAEARQITVGTKRYGDQEDRVFKDGLGREVLFRGFNVSGKVKHAEFGFKPFENAADAARSFKILKKAAGSNIVRFTVAWEGIHTAPDAIDYDYLDQIIAQMREAIHRKMYILLDYHSDLYSRHTFGTDNKHTGNGAPEWIVKGGDHGVDNPCTACLFTWAAHKTSDAGVRSAIRSFWLNDEISTESGTRRVQDEFIWQIGQVVKYLKKELTPEEFDYVLGVEPLNEPFDGGISDLELDDYADFDNQIHVQSQQEY